MKTKPNNKLLRSISNVYEHSFKSKLNNDLFKKIDKDLKTIATYLQVTKNQAFIASLVFTLNYKGDSVDFKDLIEYLDCNPIHLLEFSKDFETLYIKGILQKYKLKHMLNLFLSNEQFTIAKEVSEALLMNAPLPEIETNKVQTIFDVLEEINVLSDNRDNRTMSTRELFSKTEQILLYNKDFDLLKRIHALDLRISNTFLYLYLIWRTLNGRDSIDLTATGELLFDRASVRVEFIQRLSKHENELVKNDLIEIVDSDYYNEGELKLSKKSIDLLKNDGINITIRKMKDDSIIEPNKLEHKELFFNSYEEKQLKMLYDTLDEDNLVRFQGRMKEKGFPSGITILLHGHPGTGKTETVYQIAKATNREIYQVDISKTKSCWFGESEKIIKRVFSDYNDYIKQNDKLPILFLNEADAIISKRKSVTSSNVAQTENAIQNIILEELEKFKGILIATTNLVDNLDPAFDRRFLFKVEFSKPNNSVKSKIWKSKLADLSDAECSKLSELFDLSGGQIDNVVRKSEIHELLNNEKTPFERLLEFCKSEQLINVERCKIGFSKKSA